jgi:twitching motility protein PilU
MEFEDYLTKMIDHGASDLFVTAKLPVSAKINGELQPMSDYVLSGEDSLELVHKAMNEKQKKSF